MLRVKLDLASREWIAESNLNMVDLKHHVSRASAFKRLFIFMFHTVYLSGVPMRCTCLYDL